MMSEATARQEETRTTKNDMRRHPNNADDDEAAAAAAASSSSYSGAEHFLAGISPTYWSHVPLFISQVHHDLKFIEGINCLLVANNAGCDGEQDITNNNNKFVPLSKCRLVGTIVAVERRTNGSVIYVIDDGTGLIDCLFWVEKELHELPPLIPPSHHHHQDGILPVGELVQVLGRIECVSVQGVQTEKIKAAGRDWESRECIREIHATLVLPVSSSTSGMEVESQHWLDCWSSLSPAAAACKLHNAVDVLEKLGPDIAAQVGDRSNLPAAGDTHGAWRLFGTKCRCRLPYKEPLLYCHCQATTESLDPHFRYRDCVLKKLLEMEKDTSGEECNHLRFQYRMIATDERLNEVAAGEVSVVGGPAVNAQRLALNTFRALRDDGIIHLLDTESDTYLLVSRERVLEPYLRTMLSTNYEDAVERAKLKKNRPSYLSKVPKARLELVRRSILADKSGL